MTNFYNKVSNGDNNTDSWKGFSILNDLLTETLSAKSNMTAISYENYDFTAEAASLEQKIKEEYNNKRMSNVHSPNPLEQFESYAPEYIVKLGAVDDENSFYGAIIKEIDKIGKYTNMLSIYQNNVNKIITSSDIDTVITKAKSDLSSMDESLSVFYDNIINDWINYTEHINDKLTTCLYLFSSLLIFFTLFAIISIILFLTKFNTESSFKIFDILFRSIYIILFLLTACTFAIGGFYGLLSKVSLDIISMVEYTFSIDNIENSSILIEKESEGNKVLNFCVNNNGDLATLFKINDIPYRYIDTLYLSKKEIKELNEISLSYHDYFDSIKSLEDTINDYLNNKVYQDAKPYIDELNRYTNWNSEGTYLDSSAFEAKYLKDIWVLRVEDCDDDYPYTSINSNDEILSKSQNCFLIEEWSDESVKIEQRYSGYTSSKGYYQTVSAAVEAYTHSLDQYHRDSITLLNDIKTSTEVLQNKGTEMTKAFKQSVSNSNNALDMISNVYEPIIGNNTIASIMNCSIMRKYLNMLYYQLDNEFNSKSKTLYIILIISSICQLAASIVMFFAIIKIKPLKDLIIGTAKGNGRKPIHNLNDDILDTKGKVEIESNPIDEIRNNDAPPATNNGMIEPTPNENSNNEQHVGNLLNVNNITIEIERKEQIDSNNSNEEIKEHEEEHSIHNSRNNNEENNENNINDNNNK